MANFYDSLFNKSGPSGSAHNQQLRPGVNVQLPSDRTAEAFGEVNIKLIGQQLEVLATILMEPVGAEGWQTGVALDASGSMLPSYGLGLTGGPNGAPPMALYQDYQRRGWLEWYNHQGQSVPLLTMQGKQDLVARGYAAWTVNEVEPLAREFTRYLAENLDADGGTTVIYWACGDGRQLEVVGDFTAAECANASFVGPRNVGFGSGTCLEPAVRYFADRFRDAANGMYIFVTDGELNDLPAVKSYTTQLCRQIAAGKRNPLKCVLIGVGEAINEQQMIELDDLDSGTDVDIWDHKIAREMRKLVEIFAEVVDENQIVAETGRILDASGSVIKQYNDGLPARISFNMPANSPYFELEVNGQRIRQDVTV